MIQRAISSVRFVIDVIDVKYLIVFGHLIQTCSADLYNPIKGLTPSSLD